jgi:hypothetical protein
VVTCISGFVRMYLGVHSFPDVVSGLVIEAFIFAGFVFYSETIDTYVTTNVGALYVPTILCILGLLVGLGHTCPRPCAALRSFYCPRDVGCRSTRGLRVGPTREFGCPSWSSGRFAEQGDALASLQVW